MAGQNSTVRRNLVLGVALLALASCGDVKDWDLRNYGGGFNTTNAATNATLDRPTPDSRGVISYPGYQVVVARRGDTVTSIADRLQLSPGDLARYNAISLDAPLNQGEVLALPARVPEENGGGSGSGAASADGQIDITSLATGAIDRASGQQPSSSAPAQNTGAQPIRHKVKRGETAYTIARLYNVPVRSLADWNGLGPDLSVHEGQVLMIPPLDTSANLGPTASAGVTPPGQQSPTPEPPSAAKPLPATTPPAASTKTALPASPNMAKDRTAASASAFIMPVNGKIIRPYVKKKNEGIDIAAAAGSPVKASANGTVAVITQNTDQVPIIVVRHADNMLTVYANVGGIKVKKGDAVKQGQTIATVRPGNPAYVHFEVRKGLESVDPTSVVQ